MISLVDPTGPLLGYPPRLLLQSQPPIRFCSRHHTPFLRPNAKHETPDYHPWGLRVSSASSNHLTTLGSLSPSMAWVTWFLALISAFQKMAESATESAWGSDRDRPDPDPRFLSWFSRCLNLRLGYGRVWC